jgi:RimJ/RimL family protein N-acetyltransferase
MSWATTASARLEDERVLLRPVSEADREGLHEIAMDPKIWRYFVSLIQTDADFGAFFEGMLADHASGTRTVFVIIDKATSRIAGSSSFGNLVEKDLRLEIGWSWLGTQFQGTGINHHAKLLLLQHAFDTLLAERVEFKTDELNIQARRGLCNIGAVEEGTFRSFNPMPSGRRRNAVYYSIIRPDWRELKADLTGRATVTVGSGST